MENIGSLALLLAFSLALFAVLASVVGALRKNGFLLAASQRAVYGVWLFLTTASGLLIYGLLTGDFRLQYVALHSNQAMPAVYKISAWWGGQEGSLLFWSWILATYSLVVVWTNRKPYRQMMPWVTAIMMTTQAFFLILNCFVVPPFNVWAIGRGIINLPDGQGLNPLRMDSHHPPLDAGHLAFPNDRDHFRNGMGLFSAWMGWLLGLGSG
jgi:cytochrome c-type biogenesis protein CcmF